MKHKKTFLAIFIVVGAVFATAFWSNIARSPVQNPVPNIVPAPMWIKSQVTSDPILLDPLGEDVKG